jgi:hypothetical protein
VYDLTDFGRDLEDIVLALERWGALAMGDRGDGDIITPDSLTIALRSAFRADAAAPLASATYRVRVGDVDLIVSVHDATLSIGPSHAADVDLGFEAGPGIRLLLNGQLSAESALKEGIVRITAGNPELLAQFAATFSLARQAVPS